MRFTFSYDTLVSRVIGALQLRDKVQEKYTTESSSPAERFSIPYITVARDPGSGGKIIAQEVAKRLGYAFYDNELIDEVAKKTKLRKQILNKVDEKGRSALQDLVQGLLNPNYVSDVTYFTQLCRVILSLAYKGKAVILGRGANFITPFAQGLHVRVTAPQSVCIQRAIEFEGHSPAKAREVVKTVEADRREFVKQYFGKDIRGAQHYDLVINTMFYTPHQAAELIITAYKHKFGKKV